MEDKIAHKIIVSYLLFPNLWLNFLTVVIPLVVYRESKSIGKNLVAFCLLHLRVYIFIQLNKDMNMSDAFKDEVVIKTQQIFESAKKSADEIVKITKTHQGTDEELKGKILKVLSEYGQTHLSIANK